MGWTLSHIIYTLVVIFLVTITKYLRQSTYKEKIYFDSQDWSFYFMNIDPNRLKSPVGVLCIAQIDVVQWLEKQLLGIQGSAFYSQYCKTNNPPIFGLWSL